MVIPLSLRLQDPRNTEIYLSPCFHLDQWRIGRGNQSLTTTSGEGGNPVARSIYRHMYVNLHTAFKSHGFDVGLAHQVNEQFGSLLATDGTLHSSAASICCNPLMKSKDYCVCHGDFWHGNLLVTPSSTNDIPKITVVDW
jgi:streptomycin 6-kinase